MRYKALAPQRLRTRRGMLDLIIVGGRVLAPEGVAEMDVAVQGERIAALALPGTMEAGARRTIGA